MVGMTTTASRTAECKHCTKPIRLYKAGIWGARKRDDPHPWYCAASSSSDGRHENSEDPGHDQ